MKLKFTAITVLIFGLAFSTTAQKNPGPSQPQSGRFLARVAITDESQGHTIRDCILLLPDGRYHREHSEQQPWSFSRTPLHKSQAFETHVFEGQLAPAEIASVAGFINQSDFRALRKPERLRQSTQFLEVLVLRESEPLQSFILSQSADYKPNQHALEPLFAWMNSMRKRKHDVSKAEDDFCRVPEQWRPRIVQRDSTSPAKPQ
jgi:hypothetical protein